MNHQPHRSELSTAEMRLAEAEDVLRAIRLGEIDALVVEAPGGKQVYTLHSADEPYRTLVEQMQEGALVLTSRGDIVYANAGFATLVGEPLESIVGGRLDRFVHAFDRHDVQALIRLGGGRCRSRLIGSASQSVEVSLSVSTTTAVSGDRLNVIVTDVSDLLAAQSLRDRADRENRTKDEFLATFAHELRNPLGAIGVAARLLEVTHGSQSRTRAHEVIARQLAYVSRLVDDLLDVERVAAGRLRLNRQPVDVDEVIRRVVVTFTDDATVDREISVHAAPVWVEGDVVRLQQVLANLMANAVKYTSPGGRITVSLWAADGDAVLSVEDTGFGISQAMLPSVFDMYVQGDRTLEHARGGLGIGLALVRRLVELHGGTVVAASNGEGRGSTFTVRLRQVAAPACAVEALPPLERRVTPRRVLLIEDSGEARERLRGLLELAGHVVYNAVDLGDGLELVRTVNPEVGIVDLSSRTEDPRLVARQFREEPQGRHMVLVALRATTAPGNDGAPDDGFDFHLTDPVDLDYLAQLVGDDAIQSHAAGQ